MAEMLCLVGLAGVGVALVLAVILTLFTKKNAWPVVGLYALGVLLILVSGFLHPGEELTNTEREDQRKNISDNTPPDVPKENNVGHQEEPTPLDTGNSDGVYRIGDTWTVDGQWSLTVTGVSETQERNQYSDKTPGAVYIVDYSYTNIGYTADSDGIFFAMDDTIVDNKGIMGYGYPGDILYYAKNTPIGATCNAQECIGVDNSGDFRLIVSKYDDNGEKQYATFQISVD